MFIATLVGVFGFMLMAVAIVDKIVFLPLILSIFLTLKYVRSR